MNKLNDFNNQTMGNDAEEESMARELIAGGVPVDTPRKYKVSTRSLHIFAGRQDRQSSTQMLSRLASLLLHSIMQFFVQINGNGCSGSLVAPNVVSLYFVCADLSAAQVHKDTITLTSHCK